MVKFPTSQPPKEVQSWAKAQASTHAFETGIGTLTGMQVIQNLTKGVDEYSDFDPDEACRLLIQTYQERMGDVITSVQQKIDGPIRNEPKEGFANERETYLRKLSEGTPLPEDLKILQHTIAWPVDMSNPHAHITCYFGDDNYSASPDTLSGVHNAVDVQLPLGSAITAPEDAVVLSWQDDFMNNDQELVDVTLYVPQSGLIYHLAHMDKLSLSNKIFLGTKFFNSHSAVRVEQGEYLGRVGIFGPKHLELHESIKVPGDVQKVFGRSYNHLHIAVSAQDIPSSAYDADRNFINPLLLFKQVYT